MFHRVISKITLAQFSGTQCTNRCRLSFDTKKAGMLEMAVNSNNGNKLIKYRNVFISMMQTDRYTA